MYNYNNTAGNENCNKNLDLPLVAKCTNPELLSTFVWPLSISSVLVISKREPWTDVGSCCGNHAAPMLKASGRGDPILVKVEVCLSFFFHFLHPYNYFSSTQLQADSLLFVCLFVFPSSSVFTECWSSLINQINFPICFNSVPSVLWSLAVDSADFSSSTTFTYLHLCPFSCLSLFLTAPLGKFVAPIVPRFIYRSHQCPFPL